MWGAQPPRQTVWREGRAGQAPLSFPSDLRPMPDGLTDGPRTNTDNGGNCPEMLSFATSTRATGARLSSSSFPLDARTRARPNHNSNPRDRSRTAATPHPVCGIRLGSREPGDAQRHATESRFLKRMNSWPSIDFGNVSHCALEFDSY
jgi:hypothetical protein